MCTRSLATIGYEIKKALADRDAELVQVVERARSEVTKGAIISKIKHAIKP